MTKEQTGHETFLTPAESRQILPERVSIKPAIEQGGLRPELEWDDRDLVIGHLITAPGYIFEENGAESSFCDERGKARAWLREHGYSRLRDLDSMYLADRDFHGIHIRAWRTASYDRI